MRIRRSGIMIAALALIAPAINAAEKVDDEDKNFLELVKPIILPSEESTYKKLKDRGDKQEFQKIFWARRDPNLASPQNEFKDKFLKDREEANKRYAVVGSPVPGYATDCARVYILLGEPDDIAQDNRWSTQQAGKRMPEIWTYKDSATRKMAGGHQEVSFNAECWGNQYLRYQLDKIAGTKVVQPNLDYRLDKNGRLVKLSALLAKDSPARAFFEQPRQDFPLAAQASFLKVAEGGTGLLGVVRGEGGSLTATEANGAKKLQLTLAARATAEDGSEAGWIEQPKQLPLEADGSFLGSFKMVLQPGKYTLNVAAIDPKGGKGSLVSIPVEVPDFSRIEKSADGETRPVASISSLFLLKDAVELPAGTAVDPADPFAAYSLGNVKLVPRFGTTLHPADDLLVLYQVYDLTLAPAGDPAAKADGNLSFKILKDGKRQISSSSSKVLTAIDGQVVGPIPLASYEPGKYQILVKLTDRNAKTEHTQEQWFEIAP